MHPNHQNSKVFFSFSCHNIHSYTTVHHIDDYHSHNYTSHWWLSNFAVHRPRLNTLHTHKITDHMCLYIFFTVSHSYFYSFSRIFFHTLFPSEAPLGSPLPHRFCTHASTNNISFITSHSWQLACTQLVVLYINSHTCTYILSPTYMPIHYLLLSLSHTHTYIYLLIFK